MGADSRMLLTACDDMHAHLYDVEHASLIEAFSGMSQHPSPSFLPLLPFLTGRQHHAQTAGLIAPNTELRGWGVCTLQVGTLAMAVM